MIRINQPECPVGSRPSELVRLLMHDARTPLNAVHGFVELLLAGAGGPLSEAALGHLIEIARAGRAIEVAMGLAQQLAEFDPAAMALDERQVDLALLLAETGFELMPPNGNQRLRAIPVPPAFWRPALDLCRSHLGGGEQPQAAPLAEIVHHAPHTLDLRLHGADMRCGGASSVLVERLLITLLGQAGAVVCSVPPHRPIVIRLMPAASVPAPVRAEACCQRGASAGASAAKTRA